MQREAQEQAAVFEWAAYQSGKWPELALMFHVPNGGYRSKAEAARLKSEGVKPGVPDIFLPVPRGGCAGLFIEMKYGRNKPTDEQIAYIDALMHMGYQVAVCYGAGSAIDTITKYMSGGSERSGQLLR